MKRITKVPQQGQTNNPERCSLLCGLSFQDLQDDCPSAIKHTFRQGTTIYTQGKRCSNLFCILSGQVKLARIDFDGNEFTTGFLTAG